jgi:hypothetical protein
MLWTVGDQWCRLVFSTMMRGVRVWFLRYNKSFSYHFFKGKTTTMGILTAEFPPTSGDATLATFSVTNNPEETRKRIGYCVSSRRFVHCHWRQDSPFVHSFTVVFIPLDLNLHSLNSMPTSWIWLGLSTWSSMQPSKEFQKNSSLRLLEANWLK